MPDPVSMGDIDFVYGSIILTALAVGVLVRRWQPVASPSLPRAQRLAVSFGAIAGAAVGSKLPFVLGDPAGLISGHAWLADGRTITFGLVGGYVGVELSKLAVGVRVKTGDSFAAPVAAAIAVGRLGCFHSGCCFGRETDVAWAVNFGDGILRHPTQIYEAVFHAVATVVLWHLGKRDLLKRQLVKLYIISYMVWRLVTEMLRPEPRGLLGLTFYQWSALAFIPLFVALWAWDARSARVAMATPD